MGRCEADFEAATDEEDLLRKFQRRVWDLEDCGLVKSDAKRLTVHIAGQQQGLVGLDQDHFRSFSITLRQFLMMGRGDVPVSRVCNIIERCCPHARLVGWNRYNRDVWAEVLQTPMGIAVDNGTGPTNYSFEKFFKLWLYSGTFHSDDAEERKLRSMPGLAPDALMMLMQRRLPGIMQVLQNISEVIRIWLDSPDEPVDEAPQS